MSTRICVSVAEESTAAAIDRMVDLAAVADIFEIRGDAMEEIDLLTLLRARVKPFLFCCRPRSGRQTRHARFMSFTASR